MTSHHGGCGDGAAKEAEGWQARLNLRFEERDGKSLLTGREREGPLAIQKILYPEGPSVCQAIILHPPGGIAGGDRLLIGLNVCENAKVQLTTPGAAKWYKSADKPASQEFWAKAGPSALLECFPQESIVFDGAFGRQNNLVELKGDAVFMGWDILCLGRRASGETFGRGHFSQRTLLSRDGRPIYREGMDVAGGSPFLHSKAGLGGYSVSGAFLAASENADREWLNLSRSRVPENALAAATLLPGVLVARYLGHSAEEAKSIFTAIWKALRPLAAGLNANEPRIWNT